MGEKLSGQVESKPTTGASAASTNTASTEEGRRGRGRPAGSTTKPTEKVPRLVNVDVPNEDKKEEEKPKRGRPKGSTQAKKKTSTAAKKKMDTSQIKMLLLTISGVIASRPNMQTFMLTDDEAAQIAEPLGAIMAKSDMVSDVAGEYADHIALVVACATIFIPKYLMYKAANPTPKKEVKSNATNQSRTSPASAGQPAGEARNTDLSKTHAKQFGGELHAILPAVTGF